MDVVADQIDVIGRGVMGLSVGCARCHDHKFDPIPTRDYYALAGIFTSTETMWGLAGNEKLTAPPTDLHVLKTAPSVATRGVRRNCDCAGIGDRQTEGDPETEVASKGLRWRWEFVKARRSPTAKSTSMAMQRSLGKPVPRGFLTALRSDSSEPRRPTASKAGDSNSPSGLPIPNIRSRLV